MPSTFSYLRKTQKTLFRLVSLGLVGFDVWLGYRVVSTLYFDDKLWACLLILPGVLSVAWGHARYHYWAYVLTVTTLLFIAAMSTFVLMPSPDFDDGRPLNAFLIPAGMIDASCLLSCLYIYSCQIFMRFRPGVQITKDESSRLGQEDYAK